MIFHTHIPDRLAAYADGELAAGERARVDAHLAGCGQCRRELEGVRMGRLILERLPLAKAPEGLWDSIAAAAERERPAPRLWVPSWAYVAATVLVATILGVSWWGYSRRIPGIWEVAPFGMVSSGEWIETDGGSRARINIGEIGSVEVEPNTRVRLVSASGGVYRLALGSGGIRAKITAPPRLFFVETPAGTAIDLGCEYDLHCDRTGAGLLRVSAGWVAFEWSGRESLVPAGASCVIRPGRNPGTPYFDDAPAGLVQALERFDLAEGRPEAIEAILREARVRDTLTLWHMLSRVEGGERERIYTRMVAFAPAPAGVTWERISKLDAESLKRWKEELAWTW